MENGTVKSRGTVKKSPEELFNKFVEAEDCPEILQTFQRLVNAVGVVAETPREFYNGLKSKLQSWKCKSLWELLDNRANLNEYMKGNVCEDIHALVIGCGPIGLRTAIELSLLGAQVVIVEKRKTFSRNNVLHLWPFLLTDFRSLGAKKFYGKFCSGAIDHISIRRLQAILLKTALILGAKVFTGVTFDRVIEPPNEDDGWKCHVTPFNDALSDYEVDVVIGADGKKNVLPGFAQIEMRGTLAIGITANFVNKFTEEETKVEEISGIAYQFNPSFFDRLKQQKGVHLENIVYYKDETHYFVMTAVKSSLLKRGVLKKDYGNKSQKLLNRENVDEDKLVCYVNDAVDYATKGQLNHHTLKRDDKGKADIAVFDFTSIKKAENSARIIERKGHKLLLALVGDSLLEPFWPTGSGCARGVLSALDAAWMIRSFAQDKPPLQILSERENIYRLLSGTSNENMHKNYAAYTINPLSRYIHIPQKRIQEVYHLYDTDDPVNADFSLGSPTGILASKGSKARRVSTAIKPHYRTNRKHIKLSGHASFDSQADLSSSASSLEDLSHNSNHKKAKNDKYKARQRSASEALTSGGEEVHEITTKKNKWGKRSKKTAKSPKSPLHHNINTVKASASAEKVKSKKPKMAAGRAVSSPVSAVNHTEKHHKRRSFFPFGRVRSKSRAGKKSPRHQSPNEVVEEQIKSIVNESQVESSKDDFFSREISSFSRNHPMRRSARDIIAEIEARNNASNGVTKRKHSLVKQGDRSLKEITAKTDNKTSFKRTTSDSSLYSTPQSKHPKTEDLWKEIESMSPCAKGAVPALSTMNPDYQKENNSHAALNDLSTAMRIAGLMAMATPLLASDCRQQGMKNLPWYSRNAGRVKETINKYDSLTSRRYGLTNDGTPLRAPNDRVDSGDRKPTLAEVAQRIISQNKRDREESTSWHPTAIAVVEGKTNPNTINMQAGSREKELEKLRRLGKELSSLDQESTDSPVKTDFSSPIYRKTFIADLNKDITADPGDGNTVDQSKIDNLNLKKKAGTEKYDTAKKRPSKKCDLALNRKDMEQLVLSLTETVSQERAETSIKFLISMFRRIQRNPKEDKFRRIFKSRVKFKKYVWTIRYAKLFLLASGWIEVGSFLLFPVEKNVREPLSILNKYLGLLESGSTVQISTIKSTPRRQINKSTPSRITSNTGSYPGHKGTPLRASSDDESSKKALDRRFSKSVPLNHNDAEWDLEMEDPLGQISLKHNDRKGRQVASALELRTPRTPDFAIIEEIEELSNTLDDLMESLEDDTEIEKSIPTDKRKSPKEIKDLCTTIDYMLDSSEEEELNRDLGSLKIETSNVSKKHEKKSAFTKVSITTKPESKAQSDPVSDGNVSNEKMKGDGAPISVKNVQLDENSNDRVFSQKSHNTPLDKSKNVSKIRRKLPKEPKANIQQDATAETSQRKVPIGRRNETLSRQISQESLLLIKQRFGSENSLTGNSANGASKERPFSLHKKTSQTDSRSRKAGHNKKKSSLPLNLNSAQKPRSSSDSGPSDHAMEIPIRKSQSVIDLRYNKSKKANELNMATNTKALPSSSGSSSLNYSSKEFVKPDGTAGTQRPKRTTLTRARSNSASVSSVGSLKGRPPSGMRKQTRDERAKRRQEISEKLECLETSYDALENSPKKTSSRKSSTASSTSSRITTTEQDRPSLTQRRNGREAARTNSMTSQSSKESQEIRNANGPAMRTRSSSATIKQSSSKVQVECDNARPTRESKHIVQKASKPQRSHSFDKPKSIPGVNKRKSTKAKEPTGGSLESETTKSENGKEKSVQVASAETKAVAEEADVDSKCLDTRKPSSNEFNDSFDDIVVGENPSLQSVSDSKSKQECENPGDDSQEDLKVELKLKNTGSWMILDYEGTGSTPPSTRNNSSASDMSHGDYSGLIRGDDSQNDNDATIPSPPNHSHSHPQTNGRVQREDANGSDIVRRNALRKKKNRKIDVKTHGSVEPSNGKKSISFGEVQRNGVKSSSLEISSKGSKTKPHLPFGLRRKKIAESCPDINGSLQPASPVISTSLNSSTSSLDNSIEKKKVSPFKLLAKKRKSPDPRSLKNA